jgi:hypothetical protein
METPFSLERDESFRFPVIFPEGMRYYESFAAADAVRYELVKARLRKSKVCYEQRMIRMKGSRSRKGRMG